MRLVNYLRASSAFQYRLQAFLTEVSLNLGCYVWGFLYCVVNSVVGGTLGPQGGDYTDKECCFRAKAHHF